MGKVNVLFSVICFFFVLFLGSCDFKKRIVNNDISFDSIEVLETYYLFNDNDKPSCNIQISFIYPEFSGDTSLLNVAQNIFIEKMFGNSFLDLNPKQAMDEYTKQYINGFKVFESTFFPLNAFVEHGEHCDHDHEYEVYKDESGYSYYTKLKNNLLFNQNGLISFTVESVSYEGGAHSSKCLYGYVIDLTNGTLIQEEQFAGKNYSLNVSNLLTEKIAAAKGISDPNELENLGYNTLDITPNNNFTVDRKGITYYFNENEIAGTMVGITPVFIPYEELKIYIKDASPFSLIWN